MQAQLGFNTVYEWADDRYKEKRMWVMSWPAGCSSELRWQLSCHVGYCSVACVPPCPHAPPPSLRLQCQGRSHHPQLNRHEHRRPSGGQVATQRAEHALLLFCADSLPLPAHLMCFPWTHAPTLPVCHVPLPILTPPCKPASR